MGSEMWIEVQLVWGPMRDDWLIGCGLFLHASFGYHLVLLNAVISGYTLSIFEGSW